jgi:hypothetical protein
MEGAFIIFSFKNPNQAYPSSFCDSDRLNQQSHRLLEQGFQRL